MIRHLYLAGLAAILSLLLPASAFALVTYNVNLAGNGETLTGTITTNGASGLLQASDITGFNLSAAGTISLDVSFSSGMYLCPFAGGCELQGVGNQIVATTQGLSTQSEIDFEPNPGFINGDIIRFVSDPATGVTQAIVVSASGSPLAMITDAGDTSLVVGTAVAAVPEPQTYALVLSGLGLVGFVARRHKKAA